jgi:hypothetical protein
MNKEEIRQALKNQDKLDRLQEEAPEGLRSRAERRKAEAAGEPSPPKSPPDELIILDRVIKKALDKYVQTSNKLIWKTIEAGNQTVKQDPKSKQYFTLNSITLHPKLEKFTVKGSDLIKRFGFTPQQVKPNKVITAYQLALFREVFMDKTDKTGKGEPTRSPGPKGFFGYASILDPTMEDPDISGFSSIKYNQMVRDQPLEGMYQDNKLQVIYHAFYPLIGQGETQEKAKIELFQGLIDTMFAWGISHQEEQIQQLTANKVETDRKELEDKVSEFNKTIEEITNGKEN